MEIDSLARFAVAEHNKKENAALQFGRVVTAEKQSAVMQNGRLKNAARSHVQNVVAGHLCCMTLEATDGGKKKVYKAQVWEKPWLNFKELQKFKLIGDASSGSSNA